ncbi:influenza virus NS1A-binding protein homolog A-like [Xenia sp. Carnegie-2017]|uniref:influenza virus NS1A-binding protein homolog A-like n=1 Tax=Xenia sp. Carnegie-2017 TaxID=2897299 RepID=UPI001F03F5DF|nr:influenza virus NS1A-binding protein homolog A-like [Xenia sp. Carnegie-2017]
MEDVNESKRELENDAGDFKRKTAKNEILGQVKSSVDRLSELCNNLSETQSKIISAVQQLQEGQNEIKDKQTELLRLTRKVTNNASAHNSHDEDKSSSDFLAGKFDIIVCGGENKNGSLESVESFNIIENTWKEEKNMTEKRGGAAAFVHDGNIFVTGGSNGEKCCNSVESLNVERSGWIKTKNEMPKPCKGHKVIYWNEKIVMTGGLNRMRPPEVSNEIYAISLKNPPEKNFLTFMLERRYCHASFIMDEEVLIFGGRTSNQDVDIKNNVSSYSLLFEESQNLKSLPYAVSNMAFVRYENKAILIGGINDEGEALDVVLMYDLKTEECKRLPPLNHKRFGCAAVIDESIIVVVGGMNEEEYLDSVEYINLREKTWTELPPMTTKRFLPTASLCS